MKKLETLLKNNQLAILHEKVNYLTHLNTIWSQMAPREILPYVKIANYIDGKLTLSVPSSAWATRIHYQIPSLRELLRTCPEFSNLFTISCHIVKIQRQSFEMNTVKRTLSEQAIESIFNTAQSIRQIRLKNSLLRLIGKM